MCQKFSLYFKQGQYCNYNLYNVYLGGPVFVYNWPKDSKPFYMRECKEVSYFKFLTL